MHPVVEELYHISTTCRVSEYAVCFDERDLLLSGWFACLCASRYTGGVKYIADDYAIECEVSNGGAVFAAACLVTTLGRDISTKPQHGLHQTVRTIICCTWQHQQTSCKVEHGRHHIVRDCRLPRVLPRKHRLCYWVSTRHSKAKQVLANSTTHPACRCGPINRLSRWDAYVLVQGKENTKCASRMQVKF
jgi:hypothetical protein